MADVDITVDCTISGQKDDFDYETENTLSQFISDLQDLGMAWATGKAPENAGFSIDGKLGFTFNGNETTTLESHGLMSGSEIKLLLPPSCFVGPKTGLVRRTRKKLTKR
jgi:hypothetical protein